MKITFAVFSLSILLLLASACFSQITHPGVDLYRAGNYSEAVKSLTAATKQNDLRSNADIWNYLGLSYGGLKDYKNAKKALEKAVEYSPNDSSYHSNLAFVLVQSRQKPKAKSESKKALELDPKNLLAHYILGSINLWDANLKEAERDADTLLKIDSGYAQAYILKSDILVADMGLKVAKGADVKDEVDSLREAVQVLKDGLEKCKNSPIRTLIANELESVGAFYAYFAHVKPVSILPDTAPEPGVTPLRILKKPRPGYTDSARQVGDQGTIKIAVIFGADGRITHTMLLKRLGYGLDEQALVAARKIEFEPQKKDGKPVPVVKMVEYTFSIY